MIDILLVSLPEMEKDKPTPGIFHLKSFLEKKGKTVKCIDGNQYNSLDLIMLEVDRYNFKWLGISVFSLWQIETALELGNNYDNVVYGGPGVTLNWKTENFIVGEGEYALLNFLNGNLNYPGINGLPPEQIKDLSELPPPDYLEITKKHTYNKVVITGSRGCVKKCTFCNVNKTWPKFIYKTGEQLANEIINVYNQTKLDISFSDSLVNGNDKEFRKMCKILSEKNIKARWAGQFVIRNKSEEYFKLIKESGCSYLTIGVESGSENVRKHMKKTFSNEVLEFNIKMLAKYKIKSTILLIIGYPTETEEDFEETLKFLYKFKEYNDIIRISPHLMFIIDDTPIASYKHLYDEFGYNWENKYNNYDIRLKRFLKLYDVMEECGYEITKYVEQKRTEALNDLNKKHQKGETKTWL